MKSHEMKKQRDLSRGFKEQDEVMTRYAESRGYRWVPSSSMKDIYQKFDGTVVVADGESHRVQYKGVIHNIPRATVLFEYTSVNGGIGWGRGRSDYVVQRLEGERLFCYSRQKALDFLVERVGEPGATVPRLSPRDEKPVMQWCGRPERSDVFIHVPIAMLKEHVGGGYRSIERRPQ